MSGEQFGSATAFGSSIQAPASGTSIFSGARPAQSSFPWTPSSQPEKVQQQPVHDGTYCGFCGKTNIKGTRFKCLQCFSYDRCEACMAAPRAWAAHDRAHHFFPVIHPGDLGDYHIVKTGAPAGPIHHGITCDGCKQNIVGAWHRCLVCDDFDFCGECIGDVKQREAHHVGHPFFPINGLLFGRSTYETMRNAYRAVTSGTFATSPSHTGINCDMCKQNPLIGVRFKCLECTDFDLCAHCFSNPTLRKTHSLKHVFFPVTTPGDLSQFNQALAIRHTQ